MDSITQAVIGAAAAQMTLGHRLGRKAALVGAVAGTLPDLDVFIHSPADPLVGIEYHRQLTHALAVVPLGAALAALPFVLARGGRAEWKAIYLAALAGWATHAPLDALTSYGTQLLWPFSDLRVAFPAVSIVDPVFTLALVAGLAVAVLRRARAPAAVAFAFCLAWLGLGAVQNVRATAVQAALAAARGDALVRGRVDPTFANQLLWRSVYLTGDGRLQADAIRVPLLGPATVRTGEAVPAVTEAELAARAPGDRRIARAARVWAWFSDGYMARAADGGIADARYSGDPAAFTPFWSLVLRPDHPEPVEMARGVRSSLGLAPLWREIAGRDARQRALDDVLAAERARAASAPRASAAGMPTAAVL